MRKPLFFLLLLAGLALAPGASPAHATVPVISPPTTGTTLFFDDFVASQFPQQWTGQTLPVTNNSTQIGGYLVTTLQRNFLVAGLGKGFSMNMIGNNTSVPVTTSANQTFTQISFKMQSFNLTNIGVVSQTGGGVVSNTHVFADLEVGLEHSFSGGFGNAPADHGIFFELQASSILLNGFGDGFSGLPATKQAIWLDMNGPAGSGTHFYPNSIHGGGGSGGSGMLYTSGNTVIDLNSMHVFTIQYNFNRTNSNLSYARFQVDNFGWMTYWDSSCVCIGVNGATSLYPFISLTVAVDYTAPVTNPVVLSQSVASQIDYVAAYNYQPASLPLGQILSSAANPPHQLPIPFGSGGGFSSGTIVQFIQFQANQLGGGNIYAGGFFLTGLILLIFSGVLGGIAKKTRLGFRGFGFMWALFSLGLGFFMLYSGVVPILLPIVQMVVSAAIVFGVIRAGGSADGGLVPD